MSHGVQLSGNEMLNRRVLSSWRKVRSDETVRRDDDDDDDDEA